MRDTARAEPLLAAAAPLEVVQLDVGDRESVFNAVEGVLASAGHIDVLVNNAAIADAGPLEFATEEQIQAMFTTNTFGPLRVAQAILPSMRARRGGRIVNCSSGASHPRMGHRLLGLYSASKAALSALTEEMAKELAPLGIEVVLIDGALRGHSQMIDQLQGSAAQHSGWGAPYRVAEQIWRLQWAANQGAPVAQAASDVADACQVIDPPLVFPPERQDWLEASFNMPDERFLRLCRVDPEPELYVGAPVFWNANRGFLAAEAASPGTSAN